MAIPCCQLHSHSTNSFRDGLAPIPDLVAEAVAREMPGIGLTDHGVLFGAPQLFKACAKAGIKPVIGMEIYEAVPHEFDMERDGEIFKIKWADLGTAIRYHHLTLWVLNEVGWRNICAIHTKSHSPAYYPTVRGKPLVDRKTLEQHQEGLMVGLGCFASRTSVALERHGEDEMYKAGQWAVETFGPDRVVMEVFNNLPDQLGLLRGQRRVAKRLGIHTQASNDVHYARREHGVENGPHHILVKSRRFKKADTEQSAERSDDGFGQWYGSDGFYMKDGDEMLATGGLEVAEITRTVETLERVDFDFDAIAKPKPPIAAVPAPGEDLSFDRWLAMR